MRLVIAMTKFSVGGEEEEEDGEEGPSSPSPRGKRQRTIRINAASQGNEPFETEEVDEYEFNNEIEEHCDRRAISIPKSCISKTVKSRRHVRSKTNNSISMFFIDPEVFDCSICFESLTIPVFQCENGHIACSSCCNKLKNKCASCSWPIGYNRCRAIEKVIESVKRPCKHSKYGCKETVNYGNESDHEKICIYAPCLCPLSDCNFMASSKQLLLHFSSKHTNSAFNFRYNCSFIVCLKTNDNYHVLREQDDGLLFILSNKHEQLGNAVTVSCIRPTLLKEAFSCDLCVKAPDLSLSLQSSIKNIPSSDCCDWKRFLLIPHDLFGSCGQIKLDICIWRNGTYSVRMDKKYG